MSVSILDGLFSDSDGRIYSAQDIYASLRDIGADDCDCLFIHSDVMFGSPLPGFKRREYLGTLYQVVESLGVKHIIVPTFTYSFCNNEDYDVLESKTSMGAFNEYVRKLDGRYRTLDPLLSVSVPLALKQKFETISDHSLGAGSDPSSGRREIPLFGRGNGGLLYIRSLCREDAGCSVSV